MAPTHVTFQFHGRRLEGIEGEPIAGALFRTGVRVLSYSVKYKRPRGIHCARGRCVMCHMEVDGTPGVPTCVTPLREGMRIRREDFRPFYAPLLVFAARLLPFSAGFYYRMFTRPAFVRKLFLGSLRRMAGVGRLVPTASAARPGASDAAIPRLDHSYDVVVVGSGLSGMAAAIAASGDGAKVLLVDEYAHTGGHSLGADSNADRRAARERLSSRVASAGSMTRAALTTALGFYPPDTLLLGSAVPLGDAPAMRRVRARSFVFATGAYDSIPLFENNDLPGIFGARAIRLLLERDGIVPGRRAVAYGTGEALADLVALLDHHGIGIAEIVEASDPSALAKVVAAEGHRWLTSVYARPRLGAGRQRIDADLLCIAFDGQGAYELPYQAGFRFEMSDSPIDENRVLRPTERVIEGPSGELYALAGEVAGDREWREKITNAERVGTRVAAAVREGA